VPLLVLLVLLVPLVPPLVPLVPLPLLVLLLQCEQRHTLLQPLLHPQPQPR
jgi:hypothetical protein